MRFAPCCWINGSDTPSWLTRLRSVVRLLVTMALACSCSVDSRTFTISGKLSAPAAPSTSSSGGCAPSFSGWFTSLVIAFAPAMRSASDLNTTVMPCTPAVIESVRILALRSVARMSST